MAQIPYSTGIKPLVKPVAKPAGNPADRNFFSGSAVPVAPKVAPTVNMVRPTGPAPVAPKDNFLRGSKASSAPVAAPSRPMSGSPSAMGFNTPYTASNPVDANDRGGDRIQKMPFEKIFDPQIQYNLFTKPLAKKYGLEGPASILNPENYSYKNLQDGISKFGNTLGNVTNLMAYGTPVGAAFAGAGQAANTAGAQGITAPGNALASAGGAAMVTFAVKNILSKGSVAAGAGQAIIELTKLAAAFGKTEIVNAVKNLTGVDISGYIDTAYNAGSITEQVPSLGIQKPSAVSSLTDPAFRWLRGGVPTEMPGYGEFVGAQIRDAQKNSGLTGVNPRYQMLPGITTRPSNLLQGHVLEYGSRMKMLLDAIERTRQLGKFNPDDVTIRQDVAGVMGNMPGSEDYEPFAGRDIYLAELPNGDTIPMSSSSQSNIKKGVDERGSIFPLGGIQYTGGYNGMGPGWFMKNYETIDAANASPYMQDLYNYVKPMNALWPRLPNGDPNTLIEHGSLQETLRTIFGRTDKTINYDDPNVVQDIMNSIQNYEYYQRQNFGDHMKRMAARMSGQ